MKKFFAATALVLAFAIGGCSSIGVKNPFDQPTLAKVETAYGAVLAIAVNYRDACAKRLIPPSCRTVVPRLQLYGRATHTAVLNARNFVRNYPNLNAVNVLIAAQQSITDFRNFQVSQGVN